MNELYESHLKLPKTCMLLGVVFVANIQLVTLTFLSKLTCSIVFLAKSPVS